MVGGGHQQQLEMAALAAIPVKRSRQGRTCSPAPLPALLRLERCAAEEAAGLKLVGGLFPCSGHLRAESAEIVVSAYEFWQVVPGPL
jgi:hypothetical protein